MKKPKFKPLEQVRYISLGKVATIVECINQEDKRDIKAYGFRYYVRCARDIWSVPESQLRKIVRRETVRKSASYE